MNVKPGRYRMRDGRVVVVVTALLDRWQGHLEDGQPLSHAPLPKGVDLVAAPQHSFFVWDDAGQDCAGDDRQHDLVRRLPPRFGK